MTITQLRYFLMLADHLNFTHAAAQLFISQSTLSQHISKLENELGTSLFTRKSSGLALTMEGKYLQDTVSSMLKELDALPQSLQEIGRIPCEKALIPSKFSIGVDSVSFSMEPGMSKRFASAISALSAQYPKTEITVSETTTNNMYQQLIDKKLDVTVGGFRDISNNRVNSRLLSSQQMNLVVKVQPHWVSAVPGIDELRDVLKTLDVCLINFDAQYTLATQKWLESMGYSRPLTFIQSAWLLQLQLQLENIAAIIPSNRLDSGFNMDNLCIFPIPELSILRYTSWLSNDQNPLLEKFIDLMI